MRKFDKNKNLNQDKKQQRINEKITMLLEN